MNDKLVLHTDATRIALLRSEFAAAQPRSAEWWRTFADLLRLGANPLPEAQRQSLTPEEKRWIENTFRLPPAPKQRKRGV